MQDLGKFMKKRTRDLAIGATLAGVGMVGAFAFLVDRSNQTVVSSGTGYISNGTQTANITETRTQPVQAPINEGRTQPTQQTYNPQPQNTGPAYQAQTQGSFTNNSANFQNTIPDVPANHGVAINLNPQPTQNFNPQNTQGFNTQSSQGLCAPEALRVGIKHFRYADANPSDLVASGYGSDPKFKIHRDAKPALQEMVNAAKRDGVTLTPGSILRTSSRQAQIVADKKKKGQSAQQIYYTSSHPGYSEHHTGLAVDFSPINHSFAKTAGYRWLKQHAHEYGFYQTFTPEYSAYSSVSEESWHWRYEGRNGEFAYVFEASKNRRC